MSSDPIRHVEHVMGTAVSFDVRAGKPGESTARQAIAAACARLHAIDATFSTWKADSEVNRIRGGDLAILYASDDVQSVADLCMHARTASGGWFDPWSLPGGWDPTGLVKGWAGGEALTILLAAGVSAALVNAAGDIATAGEPEPGVLWVIGVRDPDDVAGLVCTVTSPGAVATSGHYERGDHIVNPVTGGSGDAFTSVTITGPDIALADALATGVVAAGIPGLAIVDALDGYEAFAIDTSGALRATPGFPFAEAP